MYGVVLIGDVHAESTQNRSLDVVKNLLTVLSSTDGRLGSTGGGLRSTWPAATEEKVSDKCAKETCSN